MKIDNSFWFFLMLVIAGWLAVNIHDDNKRLRKENSELSNSIQNYENRINSLHELDTKHTTELTNAKAEIDKLRDDVRSGRKRVYINAECTSAENSSTSSVDVSRSTPVARDTEENILNLEEQLETLEKQYLGLRDYYFTECKR
ncbi:lysis protein [Providencia sp. PROV188]|uniref:lysis protein n=1 Tax=Providencia sp. PROV188 TaxID=2939731 RepID=UPI0012B5DC53|nr:lysis protein [Providencia sp. PROV188]MTC75562.1 lysis protein [Providencia sp. wls1919]WBM59286.1 lysis protein [Providencia sp. PROV188]